MTELDIVCDRCGKMVRVHRIEHWTAGAYDMSAPAWRQFAREGERYVCTPCMHADPDYRAAYGEERCEGVWVDGEGALEPKEDEE